MPENLPQLLEAATAEVLETMFFAAATGEPTIWPSSPGACAAAAVRFSGTHNGMLTIRVPEEAARTMAAGFLGVDADASLTPGRITEVVCEMANMICGAMLSHMDPDGDVRLDPPAPPETGAVPPDGAVEAVVAVDEGPVAVNLAFCR